MKRISDLKIGHFVSIKSNYIREVCLRRLFAYGLFFVTRELFLAYLIARRSNIIKFTSEYLPGIFLSLFSSYLISFISFYRIVENQVINRYKM